MTHLTRAVLEDLEEAEEQLGLLELAVETLAEKWPTYRQPSSGVGGSQYENDKEALEVIGAALVAARDALGVA